ncbi:transketolase family protein [Paenibacillus wenxiniae]|uniref:Transketolase family protein n=1 Tax=Paenibacillus wenxiniae TaxID=1636843 RepID=A0ABW4RHJ9_9BACL
MTLSGRDAYKDELTRLAQTDTQIVALEADLGGKKHPFEQQFPDRFFNLGIAEMTAVDLSAGLAEGGFTPFFSTFAPFVALRCAEHIKLALGYMRKNIKIVSCYGGVSGGWFGTTHHALEDIGVMQTFENIRIACPHGEEETRRVIREAAASPEPYYIRLSRNDTFDSLPSLAEDDELIVDRNWNEDAPIALVSVGEQATEMAIRIKRQQPEWNHVHLCYVDKQALITNLQRIEQSGQQIVVLEEHRRAGGVGSYLSLLLPHKQIYAFTPNERWPKYGGSHQDVLDYLGFTEERLYTFIHDIRKGSLLCSYPY